mmetsp:Transcript_59044/g.93403  ORF Transcript_59044/g.93403 Transcript_59044/m.93403 type:complete len:211 (+) Transcript_59044:547-1179(+)
MPQCSPQRHLRNQTSFFQAHLMAINLMMTEVLMPLWQSSCNGVWVDIDTACQSRHQALVSEPTNSEGFARTQGSCSENCTRQWMLKLLMGGCEDLSPCHSLLQHVGDHCILHVAPALRVDAMVVKVQMASINITWERLVGIRACVVFPSGPSPIEVIEPIFMIAVSLHRILENAQSPVADSPYLSETSRLNIILPLTFSKVLCMRDFGLR